MSISSKTRSRPRSHSASVWGPAALSGSGLWRAASPRSPRFPAQESTPGRFVPTRFGCGAALMFGKSARAGRRGRRLASPTPPGHDCSTSVAPGGPVRLIGRPPRPARPASSVREPELPGTSATRHYNNLRNATMSASSCGVSVMPANSSNMNVVLLCDFFQRLRRIVVEVGCGVPHAPERRCFEQVARDKQAERARRDQRAPAGTRWDLADPSDTHRQDCHAPSRCVSDGFRQIPTSSRRSSLVPAGPFRLLSRATCSKHRRSGA